MRFTSLRAVLGAVVGAALLGPVALSAQQSSTAGPATPAPKTLTLTGCVEQGGTPNQFTLTDEQGGTFEVKGSRIGRYLGKRVQIAGSQDNARLRIRGGLYPSPNVAAQRGSMDPARAAMESMPGGPGSGTGEVALPTFKVRSVKTLDGACG